jgi:hypothetical protein
MRGFPIGRAALALLLWIFATAASASFHLWRVNELYSNADGTVQFVEFREIGAANGEEFVGGQPLVSARGNDIHRYAFPTDLPGNATANRFFLAATQGFANLGIVAPDFIIPDGFLFVQGGTLRYGQLEGPYSSGPVDTITYPALPTDGATSIDRNGTPQAASPTNFAGATGTIGAVATVSPQTGWWWNPAESGRGYFIERQGTNLFFAAYLYADSGRALWTISAGPMASSASYQGTLATFGGGQTLTGAYMAPAPGAPLGAMSLQFADAAHATLTWPGGTVAIQRFDYAGLAGPSIASAPETGWWWNGGESGRGFSLEVQGSTLFVAGYMYDAAGNPVWYTSVGALGADGSFHGTWTQFANGQTLTGAYRPPTVVDANAGALTLQFSDAQNGVLMLPDNRTIPITRFRF